MNIKISMSSGEPIYSQIYKEIKNEILKGAMSEGEALPSIRLLAKDLRISVITTKRAYEELEKDGFIYTLLGKGSFVAKKNLELLRESNLKQIEDYMEKIKELSKCLEVDNDELFEMFKIILNEE